MSDDHIHGFQKDYDRGVLVANEDQLRAEAKETIGKAECFFLCAVYKGHFIVNTISGLGRSAGDWAYFLSRVHDEINEEQLTFLEDLKGGDKG